MVLQRAPQRAIVWGYTDTFNASLTLTFNEKVYYTQSSSVAGNLSNASIWSITLDAQTEEGPFQINVTQISNGTLSNISLDDVLFGDVWVCSGQSNMEMAVSEILNGSIEIANAGKYPKIRLLTPANVQADVPVEEPHGIAVNWLLASPETVGRIETSAVCWVYGRMIHEGLGRRPMGLLHSSWGGTEIEFWSTPEALKDCGISSQVFQIEFRSIIYLLVLDDNRMEILKLKLCLTIPCYTME
jgi:sialate O-acetylesterase